jgi:histidyl-tRNA synthetase
MLNDYPKLGSVCSGGRYDNLTGYYTKQKMPGIGISIGLTRLFSQLKEEKVIEATKKSLVEVLVIPMGAEQMPQALLAAQQLRQADIKTDVYYQQKGMKQKMKYAGKLGIPYVMLIGEEEAANAQVTLKDMNQGQQATMAIEEAIAQIH